MKKFFAAIMVIVMLITLAACGEDQSNQTADDKGTTQMSKLPDGAWRDSAINTSLQTTRNVSYTHCGNNYIAALQGDTVYYVANNKLYREDLTGKHEKESFELENKCTYRYVNPIGDYVYLACNRYTSNGTFTKSWILSVNIHTGENEKIVEFEQEIDNLIIDEGFMYYMLDVDNPNSDKIYRAELNATGQTALAGNDDGFVIGGFTLYKERIYYGYSIDNNRQICSMALDGSDDKIVIDGKTVGIEKIMVGSDVVIIGDNLYFTDNYTNPYRKVSLNGGELETTYEKADDIYQKLGVAGIENIDGNAVMRLRCSVIDSEIFTVNDDGVTYRYNKENAEYEILN